MMAGANICPQTAVALDGVLQARGDRFIKEDEVVVTIGTASGIKFAASGITHHLKGSPKDFANPPQVLPGNIAAIEKALSL
ncbi:MAG: hypothetical protein UV41_C0006G0021 [Candidatus Daviesbacteria bacterium GW2011_GWA2_42_7]|nr:MAG: hypothetical protein UV41_C0006G0021 [Candidatus Daviesbacteria bacterium GW2011_GWA2_42_7]